MTLSEAEVIRLWALPKSKKQPLQGIKKSKTVTSDDRSRVHNPLPIIREEKSSVIEPRLDSKVERITYTTPPTARLKPRLIGRTLTSLIRKTGYASSTGPMMIALDGEIRKIQGNADSIDVQGFVPREQIGRIVNEETVLRELRRLDTSIIKRVRKWVGDRGRRRTVEDLARITCGIHHAEKVNAVSSEKFKTYRKIFALSVRTQRVAYFAKFIEEGICDADLPLIKVPHERAPNAYTLRLADDPSRKLKCFTRWSLAQIDLFEEEQWKFLVPVLTRDAGRYITTYRDSTILPFTEKQWIRTTSTREISKVRFHPDHYEFGCEEEDDDDDCQARMNCDTEHRAKQLFALKSINLRNDVHITEIRILKRVSHAHIIPLLLAYTHKNRIHYIFPWAECNLAQFWEKGYPNQDPTQDPNAETLYWITRECLGIAGGLNQIHHHPTTSVSSLFNDIRPFDAREPASAANNGPVQERRPSLARSRPIHRSVGFQGFHGDMKPSNILWFPKHRNQRDRGTLKICDFGAGDFWSSIWKADSAKPLSYTPAYRPPDGDCNAGPMHSNGASGDMWGLGCVLLEFITWYLGGWTLLSAFVQSRNDSSLGSVAQTSFFEEIRQDDDTLLWRIKPVVTEHFETLRRHESCTPLTHRILAIIETRMLIVENHTSFGHPEDDEPLRPPAHRRRISCGHFMAEMGKAIDETTSDYEWELE